MVTKQLLCTLGPSSREPRVIRRLTDLGVNLFRINLSHTRIDEVEGWIHLVRQHSNVPLCLDTQGAQVRTGRFGGGVAELEVDTVVELVSATETGTAQRVPVYPDEALHAFRAGDVLSVDFGTVLLQVIDVSSRIKARVLSGGIAGSNKGIATDRDVALPPLTDVDRACIEIGKRHGIKHVALSFANRASDVRELRALVGDDVQIIAKIESRDALNNLDGILEEADAVLVDRGDLSREVLLEALPFVQKEVLRRARARDVPAYVATNLLETMITSPRPTRAEVNDVISTLLDGASGLVLAAETAVGKYPIECVGMARALVRQFERFHDGTRSALLAGTAGAAATSRLVEPLGGQLVEQVRTGVTDLELKGLPVLAADERVLMDVRQICLGGFSPLTGFMDRHTLRSVLDENRLPSGVPWTMPVLLPIPAGLKASAGDTVVLRDANGPMALLTVSEIFSWDTPDLAQRWFGTTSDQHPGVARTLATSDRFAAGRLELMSDRDSDTHGFDLTPSQARTCFDHRQWQKVVAFHTRNVPHRAHEYLQLTALERCDADGVFIHPVIGPKKTGDFDGDTILRAYWAMIQQHYPEGRVVLSGLRTYSRYAGPREAVFTATIRQNFGCSHFIVGRDHTGVGDFYSSDASRRIFETIQGLAIQPVFFGEVLYCRRCGAYVENCQHGDRYAERISGTQAREMLRAGDMLPDWFMRDTVSRLILDELERGAPVFVG